MKATQLVRNCIVYSPSAFAAIVLSATTDLLKAQRINSNTGLPTSSMASVLCGTIIKYRGDHRHFGEEEFAYTFVSPEQLVTDFKKGLKRWNGENGST
jgi:hypothetical protein